MNSLNINGLCENFQDIAEDYEVQKIIKQNRALCYIIEAKKYTIDRMKELDEMINKLQNETNFDNKEELARAEQMFYMILKNSWVNHEKKVLVENSELNRVHRRVVENLNRDREIDELYIKKMKVAIDNSIAIYGATENYVENIDEIVGAEKRVAKKNAYLQQLQHQNALRKEEKQAKKLDLLQKITEIETQNIAIEFSCEKLKNRKEQMEREVGELKNKIADENILENTLNDDDESDGTISMCDLDTSFDLSQSFDEIVFKDPNDFPTLQEFIESQKMKQKPALKKDKDRPKNQQRKKVSFADQKIEKRSLRSASNANLHKSKSSYNLHSKKSSDQPGKLRHSNQNAVLKSQSSSSLTGAKKKVTSEVKRKKLSITHGKQNENVAAQDKRQSPKVSNVSRVKIPVSELAAPTTPIAVPQTENDPKQSVQIEKGNNVIVEEFLQVEMNENVEGNKASSQNTSNNSNAPIISANDDNLFGENAGDDLFGDNDAGNSSMLSFGADNSGGVDSFDFGEGAGDDANNFFSLNNSVEKDGFDMFA